MLAFVNSIIVAIISFLGRTLGIKFGMLAVVISTVVVLVTGTNFLFAEIFGEIGNFAASNEYTQLGFQALPEELPLYASIYVSAEALIWLYKTQWAYVKLYISAASWKVL